MSSQTLALDLEGWVPGLRLRLGLQLQLQLKLKLKLRPCEARLAALQICPLQI